MTRATAAPSLRPATLAGLTAAGLLSMGAAPTPPQPAVAPAAPAPAAGPHFGTPGAPYDISADSQELFQQERRIVYKGSVEVVQGTSRLRTPQLTILYAPKPGTPGGPPPPPAGSSLTASNKIQHMDAEGPVFLVTPTQSAKGDHGTYEASTDIITLIGNVTLLQDKNVATGDKLVIEQTTGHSVMTMNTPAQRVRGVFYSQDAAATPAPGAPAPGVAPAAKPAKTAKSARP